MDDLILAIDMGTQSIRAIVFNLKGEIVKYKKTDIESYYSPQPGWAEQKPEYFWQQLCHTTRSLLRFDSKLKQQIRGVSLTTMRCTLLNLDKEGRPLRAAIVWPDQRRTKDFKRIGGIMGLGIKLIGMEQTVRFAQGESEINWLNRYEPEIMEKTDKFIFLSGYMVYKLTGCIKDSYASQVGYIPFDYKNFTWCKKGHWKWQAFPIEKQQLPELVAPAQLLDTICKKAAKESGIPAGIPLIASGSDKTCELLGSGCINPRSLGVSMGTSATVGIYSKKYLEVVPFIPPYPAAIPGVYNPEIQIYRGFWLVSWFKQEFGLEEKIFSQEKQTQPEVLFDKLLEQVPPGSQGLILQPTWSAGVKIPGPEAKGAIIGFGDVHTRAHLYRAIIEGLCYSLKRGAERIQNKSRILPTEVRVSGGGTQSDKVLQIAADIFNLPVLKPHIYDTSSLGAAIDMAVGLKLHPDFTTAVKQMTRVQRVYQPTQENAGIYSELYHKIYRNLYKKLKPFYCRIREITRYPD